MERLYCEILLFYATKYAYKSILLRTKIMLLVDIHIINFLYFYLITFHFIILIVI